MPQGALFDTDSLCLECHTKKQLSNIHNRAHGLYEAGPKHAPSPPASNLPQHE